MILTLTLHPSIDRSLELATSLVPGGVTRTLREARDVPAGKGVNVTRTLTQLGSPSTALVAARADDPFTIALHDLHVSFESVAVQGPVRTNLTLVDPDGTTTKVNQHGPPIDARTAAALIEAVERRAASATWLVIAGSLPPGTDAGLLSELTEVAIETNPRLHIAADSSGRALTELVSTATLVKPNETELAELLGLQPESLSRPVDAIRAAQQVHDTHGCDVLLTLGGDGAALVTTEGTWQVAAPKISLKSTVGAGDASLAGYLDAALRDLSPQIRLQRAVAAGSAAASLPGTTIPTLDDIAAVVVHTPTPLQEQA